MEKNKTRMNLMVLGWHWRYYDELMVFSIYRQTWWVDVYTYIPQFCLLRGPGNQHPNNSEYTEHPDVSF